MAWRTLSPASLPADPASGRATEPHTDPVPGSSPRGRPEGGGSVRGGKRARRPQPEGTASRQPRRPLPRPPRFPQSRDGALHAQAVRHPRSSAAAFVQTRQGTNWAPHSPGTH